MRRNGIRFVAAAGRIMAAVGTWQLSLPKSLFARTTQAMIEAKGYRCDLSEVRPAEGEAKAERSEGRLFWASGGEQRLEWGEVGEVMEIEIRRPGEPGLSLMPKAKKYRVLPQDIRARVHLWFCLAASAGTKVGRESQPRSGRSPVVRPRSTSSPGRAWSATIRARTRGCTMWLDPATSLRWRVDIVGMGPKAGDVFRLENFRWGRAGSEALRHDGPRRLRQDSRPWT